jgi:hypothetical protein
MEKKWQLPDTYRYGYPSISLDLLRALADEAEKYLAETTKTADSITAKARWAIPIGIGIFSTCLGYLVTPGGDFVLNLTCVFVATFCMLSGIYLFIADQRYSLHVLGSPPSLVILNDYIEDVDDQQSQEKIFLLNKCLDFEDRISFNDEINMKRQARVNLGILLLQLSPLSFILARIVGFFYNLLIPDL